MGSLVGMGGLHTVALLALMLVAWAKSLPHYGPCHGWGWGSGREMFHRGTSGRAVETRGACSAGRRSEEEA